MKPRGKASGAVARGRKTAGARAGKAVPSKHKGRKGHKGQKGKQGKQANSKDSGEVKKAVRRAFPGEPVGICPLG